MYYWEHRGEAGKVKTEGLVAFLDHTKPSQARTEATHSDVQGYWPFHTSLRDTIAVLLHCVWSGALLYCTTRLKTSPETITGCT